jgi:[ribosomal protein S18]-alanine N-acetyltransferase
MDFDSLPVRVQNMTVADLGEVLNIEHVSFPSPWSSRAYEYELRYNEMAHYFIACANAAALGRTSSNGGMLGWLKRALNPAAPNGTPLTMVGYVGYWLMAGEAHISTIAVRPELRGHSYGELLLAYALQDAAKRSAHVATLEVRVSNASAQQLYLKYGFEKVGLRKAYYSDNNEDAYIMTTPPLNSAQYQQKYSSLKTALLMRLNESATAH